MEKCFNENRKFIMGMAIILIVFFHTDFQLPSIITYIRRLGYIQVDVFMLLSGFGVYYSYSRSQSIKQFYFKRIARILPTYWILAIPFFLLDLAKTEYGFLDILGVYTATSLWIPEMSIFSWFAQLILFTYFLSPILIELVKNAKNKYVILLLSFVFSIPFLTSDRLMMATARIAPFVFGIILASKNESNCKFKKNGLLSNRFIIVCLIFGILLLGCFKLFLTDWLQDVTGNTFILIFWPGILLAPGIIMFFSKIHDWLHLNKITRLIEHVISTLGEFTFEIYIFQSLLYMIFGKYYNGVLNNWIYLILFFMSIFGGILFGKYIAVPLQKRILAMRLS